MEKLKSILEKNNTVFISCFFIILFSIFLRSMIDIGADTAFYIDLGGKIANGKQYYYDFFESNFPLSFYFYALQHYFSQFFNINPILTSEIFINILGIFVLFFANKILEKDILFQKRKDYKNLLIIAFALSFFLRINAISIGEFGTKTSFILLGLFIYIPYSLIDKIYLTRKDFLARGSSMALIFGLKPHYGIFIICIEIFNLYKTKSLKFFIELDKIFAIFLILLYINLMMIYTPQYFEFMVPMWSQYYSAYTSKEIFFDNILKHFRDKIFLFSIIFVIFVNKKMSKEDVILSLFFAASSL